MVRFLLPSPFFGYEPEAEAEAEAEDDAVSLRSLEGKHVSRLFSGEDAALNDENMVALLKVFSADQSVQAELVAARCMDARVGPGPESRIFLLPFWGAFKGRFLRF